MKNWKTTLIGCVGAIWIAIQPIIATGEFDFSKDWKNLIGAAFVAGFSFVVKDFNVTGGDVINDPNVASVVKESAKTNNP
jgi:hypothetical protein